VSAVATHRVASSSQVRPNTNRRANCGNRRASALV